MNKKIGIPKRKKIINLTKAMQEKYAELVNDFKEVVIFSSRVETKYLASFNCGILRDARRHLIKDANIVLLRAIGLNRAGNDVKISAGMEMTIMELKALKKSIDETIEIYETKVRGKLQTTIEEEAKRQKVKTNKLANFKIEK